MHVSVRSRFSNFRRLRGAALRFHTLAAPHGRSCRRGRTRGLDAGRCSSAGVGCLDSNFNNEGATFEV
jgi:hypothetical protein